MQHHSGPGFGLRFVIYAAALGVGGAVAHGTDLGRARVALAMDHLAELELPDLAAVPLLAKPHKTGGEEPGKRAPAPPKDEKAPTRDSLKEKAPEVELASIVANVTALAKHVADQAKSVTEPRPAKDPHMPEPLEPWDGLGKNLGKGMVVTGATPHRIILFTFDDGPDIKNTPRLLDYLEKKDIGAVFFLTAERLRQDTNWGKRHALLARELVARGHMVGNHTVDHVQLPLLRDEEVVAQLDESERIFTEVFGDRTWLLRPPGGARSKRVDGIVERRGYTQFLWNLGAGDFQVRTAEEVFETWRRVFERRERENGDRGGIILLHDMHDWSVDAVPLIVSELEHRNCALLEAGEELYDIVSDPGFFVTPREGAPFGTPAPPAMPDPALLEIRQARLRAATARRCRAVAMR